MKLEAVDYTADHAAEAFVESLRNTGFGVLTHHPIPQQVVDDLYTQWKAFFYDDAKRDYLYNADTYDGFFPAEQAEAAKGRLTRDIKEYFHYYPWGQCPESLRASLQRYYDLACGLASELLTWVEHYSPPEVSARYDEPLSQMMQGSEQSLLRVLHYPPLAGDESPDAIRASAHEDINLLTILPAANEPGLQVQLKDGSWLDVPCDFGNLIVNIGDMLQEASGGYFPSTTHRVINPEGMQQNRSRISVPLFLHPRPDVVLSPRYTADAYLAERLAELRVAAS